MPSSRWNDQAIDGLERRVEQVDERTLLVPERLARIEQILKHLADEFDRLTEEGDASVRSFDWKMLLSVAGTVVVPIVVAIIATK